MCVCVCVCVYTWGFLSLFLRAYQTSCIILCESHHCRWSAAILINRWLRRLGLSYYYIPKIRICKIDIGNLKT